MISQCRVESVCTAQCGGECAENTVDELNGDFTLG